MNDLPELPPLPEADGASDVVVGTEPVAGMMADVVESVDAWSKERVHAYARAYGRLCADMQRETLAAAWEKAHGFDKYGVGAFIRQSPGSKD
jgi:hypothetical protein